MVNDEELQLVLCVPCDSLEKASVVFGVSPQVVEDISGRCPTHADRDGTKVIRNDFQVGVRGHGVGVVFLRWWGGDVVRKWGKRGKV